MIRILLICIVLFFSCCSSQQEKSAAVIEKNEMTELFRDILLAESYVESYLSKDTTLSKDTLLRREIDLVLRLHKVDAKAFSRSYRYYKSHPDLFKLLMDSASSRFSRDKEDAHQKFKKLAL